MNPKTVARRSQDQLDAAETLAAAAPGYRVIPDPEGWPVSPGTYGRLEHLGNSGGLLPKTGSLQPEWRRCGKLRCRCISGTLHGPYWYLRWREGGRQRRQYVPWEQVDAMRAALAQRRRLRPPAWSLRQELAELRQLAQEVRDERHDG
jgi:hypothetical protein